VVTEDPNYRDEGEKINENVSLKIVSNEVPGKGRGERRRGKGGRRREKEEKKGEGGIRGRRREEKEGD
jgi:hypothetical protein